MTLAVLFLSGSAAGCAGDRSSTVSNANNGIQESNNIEKKGNKMKIKIGSNTFSATLFESETATAFKALLPLTIKMDELNGNEKKYDFSKGLPTNSTNPKTINNGDLMIWGSNTLVLFYKTFPTQYSYTKLGKVNDSSGLEAAVGAGDVTVTFELE
jgi:hypothetical protein